jgi:hypothetical protein
LLILNRKFTSLSNDKILSIATSFLYLCFLLLIFGNYSNYHKFVTILLFHGEIISTSLYNSFFIYFNRIPTIFNKQNWITWNCLNRKYERLVVSKL